MFSRSVSSCVSPAIGLTTIVRSFSPQFGLPTQICESGIDKAKGRVSFERSPLLSDLSKIWFGFQITTTRHFRVVRDVRAKPAVSRTLPLSHSQYELPGSIPQQPVA